MKRAVFRGRAWVPVCMMACSPQPMAPDSPSPHGSVPPPASVPPLSKVAAGVSFTEDLSFLRRHGDVLVLEHRSGGRVAISPTYQGRVMTSAVSAEGQSLGWIFREFIEEGKTGTQFDNYGGEDRFWLGPEGGQFGLYFSQGKPFTFEHWQTPAALQQGAWDVREKTATSVRLHRSMTTVNHTGTRFSLEVARTLELIDEADAERLLAIDIPAELQWVAFASQNEVRNTGDRSWEQRSGLLSIWILAMFTPSPDTFVAVPYRNDGEGPVVIDDYFGKVPEDRLEIDEEHGVVLFHCDAQHRSKIGLGPSRAKGVLGSYSASSRLLTIVHYDRPAGAIRYVNSKWEIQQQPYRGEVVNSYNDGPTEPGKPALGGFYEMESSSPALALAPGETVTHVHRTFHFVGSPEALDPIARKVLGVPIARIARGTR